MNVEELDGFFAALVAGPELVMPSEWLPSPFGRCRFNRKYRPMPALMPDFSRLPSQC